MFSVYVDWTCETSPRAFYVGKGKSRRLQLLIRNKRHRNVSAKYGLFRETVFSTDDEERALAEEVRLISELRTFVYDPLWNGLGCNYTRGGEGSSGSTHVCPTHVRQRMSALMLGNKNGLGRIVGIEQKAKISASLMGHEVTKETREKISLALSGRTLTDEHVKRSALAHVGLGKAVSQLDNKGGVIATFASARIASDLTGASRSKICECCKGRRQRAAGFGWRYAGK